MVSSLRAWTRLMSADLVLGFGFWKIFFVPFSKIQNPKCRTPTTLWILDFRQPFPGPLLIEFRLGNSKGAGVGMMRDF